LFDGLSGTAVAQTMNDGDHADRRSAGEKHAAGSHPPCEEAAHKKRYEVMDDRSGLGLSRRRRTCHRVLRITGRATAGNCRDQLRSPGGWG
jgi:hypothetical protein